MMGRRWRKMRGGQQLLWQQQSQTTVQTTSVDEAVSVCPAPGQGNTHVAADLDGEDSTVSKVQVTGFLLYWYVPQKVLTNDFTSQ
jgi:hypothetical protein